MMKIYSFVLLLLCTLTCCYGQNSELNFDHFTQKTGLPDQQIQFVQQDEEGYIWIGTLLGLVRYDGYKLKVYPLEKNKTDYFMRSMITDDAHNLWFSTVGAFGNTEGGLFRYNRATDNFTRFDYPENKGVKNVQIFLRFADNKGNLWGYSESSFFNENLNQVVRFNPKTKKYLFLGDAGPAYPGSHIVKKTGSSVVLYETRTNGGQVWLGSQSGLSVFSDKDNSFHPVFTTNDTAKQKSVQRIFEAPSEPGILWINLFDHAARQWIIERYNTRDKSFKDFTPANTPGLATSNGYINAIYEDSEQRLWITSQNKLYLFDRKTRSFTAFAPLGMDNENVFSIKQTNDGLLWLLRVGSVLTFDPQTHVFKQYKANPDNPYGLNLNNIYVSLVDHSGTIWIGDLSDGVDKLNTLLSAFITYPIKVRDGSYYQVGFTNNIIAGADGYCWFTNEQGIFKLKPGGTPELVYHKQKTDIGLDAIFKGTDGKVYFGNKRGLQVYDPATKELKSYTYKKDDPGSLNSNGINRIIQDHTGLVWIGTTDEGICSFDRSTGRFKRYPYAAKRDILKTGGKLDGDIVDCIYEDSRGTVWVGTHLGGLNRFDRKSGKFTSFYMDGNLNVYTVTHLLDDKAGHLWVGTYSLGVFEFDIRTGHFINHFNEDNGLLFNTVTGITKDDKGFLWIGSVRGLTRIDPSGESTRIFPVASILKGHNLLSDYNLAQVNNTMLIAMQDGIAMFNPRDLEGNKYPPVVHIEKVSYSNPASKSDSVTSMLEYGRSELKLPHNQNRVTFNYIALHYVNSAQNTYAYRLDGYENHWVQAGTQRTATYTNLSPGTYTFHVKAANSDGVWNETGASFILIINTPWWSTWWAWLIYIVVFCVMVYAFIAYRSRKLLHDNAILEEKVQLRTEEVFQQKEEIEAQRDNLEKAFSELQTTQTQLIQSEKMASLGELTAGIAHEIQNPLNFVNNFSEVSIELLGELKEEVASGNTTEVMSIADDLSQNLEKINHHGKRADFIVKGMLQHSRTSTGERQLTNINTLAGEFFKLSYHGLRAKDKSFNAELTMDFDDSLPKINIVQQDIGRVLLNLFNNAFYSVNQKSKTAGPGYKPEVSVSTSADRYHVIISVKDNGNGVSDAIKDKIMQPFFTTKPTGDGTGLGLSLSYDIVVKGHGGSMEVQSEENSYALFIVKLPLLP